MGGISKRTFTQVSGRNYKKYRILGRIRRLRWSHMPSPHELKRVLFIRLDRIGDLVVTLPVDHGFTASEVQWWISPGLRFITEAANPPRTAIETPRAFSFRAALKAWRELRRFRPEAAIAFHAPWWIGLVLWLARVPVRVGPRSQWHSFLFFNRGVRQRRSQSTMHEFEYNVRLVEDGLKAPRDSIERRPLALRSSLPREAKDLLLERHRLRPGDYFVVHPGMAGSALNWPPAKWIELIRKLSHTAPVAITGTAADELSLAPLRPKLVGNPAVRWLDGKLSAPELLAVLASARAVAAPSTGVAHLAAALGRNTISIYSPVLVQAPRRWAPLGRSVRTLMPEVRCPARLSCLGESCALWNCMERVEVTAGLSAMRASETLRTPEPI